MVAPWVAGTSPAMTSRVIIFLRHPGVTISHFFIPSRLGEAEVSLARDDGQITTVITLLHVARN
jgi:hypothetical protein